MFETRILTQAGLDLQLSIQGQSNASGNLLTLRDGKLPTQRTPLYKDLTEDQVFEKWMQTLVKYQSVSATERLVNYDVSRMGKVGPQGGYPPFEDRKGDFAAYYTTPDQSDLTIDEDIIQEMISELFGGVRDRRPLSYEKVLERDILEDKVSTNSGPPDVGKKSDKSIQDRAVKDAYSGIWKVYCMILGSRSQRGKARFIFMAAFALTLVEKSFLYPLLDHVRSLNLPFFSAWEGFDEVEFGFDSEKFFKGEIFIQQDYTAMDKSINKTHQKIFLKVVGPFFQERYRLDLEDLLEHIFTVEIMISLNKVTTGRHGMPSGSGFTNFLESIISYYVMKLNQKNGLPVSGAQGLGDDLAFSLTGIENSQLNEILEGERNSYGLIEAPSIANVLSENSAKISLKVEPEKQGISDTTMIYLQRLFDVELTDSNGMCLGMYPSILAINTALNPERFHDPQKWSGDMEILRWIMILENCINLPYIDELIQFFIQGDKYALGLNLPDFFVRLPTLYEKSKAIKGFVPTYNQESIDRGIYQFGVVQKLLEMSRQLA
jgi:hypothetical protein